MHNKECSLDAGVAGVIAMDAGIDPQLAVEAGEDAQDLLSFIRDAARTKSDKAKARYLKKAQAHLKDVNAREHPDLVQAVQARILALQGRGGDTELAHVTPGEMVLPAPLQTPEVMAAVQAAAQNAGIDMGQYTVGAPANSVNPETGVAEYTPHPAANPPPERKPVPITDSKKPEDLTIYDLEPPPPRRDDEKMDEYIRRFDQFYRDKGLPEVNWRGYQGPMRPPERPGRIPIPEMAPPKINPFDP